MTRIAVEGQSLYNSLWLHRDMRWFFVNVK